MSIGISRLKFRSLSDRFRTSARRESCSICRDLFIFDLFDSLHRLSKFWVFSPRRRRGVAIYCAHIYVPLGVWQNSENRPDRSRKINRKSTKGVENEEISTNGASFSSGGNSESIIKWPKFEPGNPDRQNCSRSPERKVEGNVYIGVRKCIVLFLYEIYIRQVIMW